MNQRQGEQASQRRRGADARERRVPVIRSGGGEARSFEDRVAVEEPLEIRIEGRALGVTMRTPGNDEELAAGLLLAEGVIRRRADVGSIAVCGDPGNIELRNVVDVFLRPGVEPDWSRLKRTMLTTSSCGLCGKAQLDALKTRAEPIPLDGMRVLPADLVRMDGALLGRQEVFRSTGGLHAAAIFSPGGDLVLLREDVGRHNAVDKAIGAALLAGLFPLGNVILMVSGRASYEIVQKAAVAGIPCLAAVSAPSSLAVDLAREFGVTLIGFLRGDSFNIYTHPERIAHHRSA